MGLLGFSQNNCSSFFCHKMGCFNRKTVEDFQEQEEKASLEAATSMDLTPAVKERTASQSQTNGKPDEEKELLDDGEADRATQPGDTKKDLD